MEKTIAALQLAEKAHQGQHRKQSGLPYIVHCFNVYSIVKEYKTSKNQDDLAAICILHDTLEDTDISWDELNECFGPIVANTVQELTNDPDQIKTMGKQAYLDSKLLGLSDYALVVKLADMLANITDSPNFSMLKRIAHHIDFLKGNRKLTTSQSKIVNHIEIYLKQI